MTEPIDELYDICTELVYNSTPVRTLGCIIIIDEDFKKLRDCLNRLKEIKETEKEVEDWLNEGGHE